MQCQEDIEGEKTCVCVDQNTGKIIGSDTGRDASMDCSSEYKNSAWEEMNFP